MWGQILGTLQLNLEELKNWFQNNTAFVFNTPAVVPNHEGDKF